MITKLIHSKDFFIENNYIADIKAKWNDDDNRRYQKIAGSLFAGALGDALGYVVEFDKWETIREEFGENGIQNLLPGKAGKAIISDDTQMTLFTCEGMLLGRRRGLERGFMGSVEAYVYYSYLNWMQTQDYETQSVWDPVSLLINVKEMRFKRLPGITCLDALSKERIASIEEPANNSKGCGGVMRTAPLGYTKVWGNAMVNGAKVAALTHGHPGGWIPGGVLSDIVFQIIYEEGKSLKEIVLISLDRAKQNWDYIPECSEFISLMEKAVEFAETDLPVRKAIDRLASNPYKGGGWTGDEALAIAVLCCLRYPSDPIECLRAAVNHTGDSDSTGAIAGNIIGAYLGLESIPNEWLADIELQEVLEAYSILMTELSCWG